MSVLIKGMKMPKNCCECRLLSGFECRALLKDITDFSVADECPFVPVPPHGRLIDADELNNMINQSYSMTDRVDVHNGYAIVQEMMKQLPTIIEAEGE